MQREGSRRPSAAAKVLATLLAAAGLLDLGSALTPALTPRLQLLQELIGNDTIRFSQTATVLAGICTLMLAQGIARRNRRAAWLAMGTLVASAILNLLKGIDFEEASFCLFVAWLLWQARSDFIVGGARISWRIAAGRAAWLAGLTVLYAQAGALLLGHQVRVLMTAGAASQPMPFPIAAFAGLWTDTPTVLYLGEQGHWFQRSLHALAIMGVVYVVVCLLKPLVHSTPATQDERNRVRGLIDSFGTDALCYFHLRPDRAYIFTPDGPGVVSYVVRGDLALLGGDPLAPPHRMQQVTRHARDVLSANGLRMCVVGASAAAMAAYRAEGLKALKIGEEAVIDLPAFDVGQLAKRVRRAARAVDAHGIQVHLGVMAELDPVLTAQCQAVSQAWLRAHGGKEQGFSMTSGPLPGLEDRRHLVVLGVAPGSDGLPGRLLGFLTLAPVPATRGLSLDHMRRVADAPNGLMEALIIRAALQFAADGYAWLSLNFATLCDKECPQGEGAPIRAARAAIFEGARHLPLRSLYRFNKKFNPIWSCRYLMYESTMSLPSAALATVRAEVLAQNLIPVLPGTQLRPR